MKGNGEEIITELYMGLKELSRSYFYASFSFNDKKPK